MKAKINGIEVELNVQEFKELTGQRNQESMPAIPYRRQNRLRSKDAQEKYEQVAELVMQGNNLKRSFLKVFKERKTIGGSDYLVVRSMLPKSGRQKDATKNIITRNHSRWTEKEIDILKTYSSQMKNPDGRLMHGAVKRLKQILDKAGYHRKKQAIANAIFNFGLGIKRNKGKSIGIDDIDRITAEEQPQFNISR